MIADQSKGQRMMKTEARSSSLRDLSGSSGLRSDLGKLMQSKSLGESKRSLDTPLKILSPEFIANPNLPFAAHRGGETSLSSYDKNDFTIIAQPRPTISNPTTTVSRRVPRRHSMYARSLYVPNSPLSPHEQPLNDRLNESLPARLDYSGIEEDDDFISGEDDEPDTPLLRRHSADTSGMRQKYAGPPIRVETKEAGIWTFHKGSNWIKPQIQEGESQAEVHQVEQSIVTDGGEGEERFTRTEAQLLLQTRLGSIRGLLEEQDSLIELEQFKELQIQEKDKKKLRKKGKRKQKKVVIEV